MDETAVRKPNDVSAGTRYEDDYTAWIDEQVALLRAGRLTEIDAENIAEELGDLGKSEFRGFVSELAIVIQHILKWDHQTERRSRSWQISIREHRRRVDRSLSDNPSFVSRSARALEMAFADARDRALDETGLPDTAIPEVCPYSFDEIMTREIVFEDKQ